MLDLLRQLGERLFARKRQHRHLDRRDGMVELQDHPALTTHLFFVIGVDHQGQHRAVDAGRRLDHVGHVALANEVIEVGEVPARCLLVSGQVEIAASRNSFQL